MSEAESEEKKPRKPSQAQLLIGLIDECNIDLCHAEGEAYARVPLANGAKAFYRVRSRDMRSFLGAKYYEKTSEGARSQSMSDAIATIEARTIHGSPAVQVALRLSCEDNEIHIDLGDDAWREVHITPEGWEVKNHTRYFRRAAGMAALPLPRKGGRLSLFRRHINMLGEERDGAWSLVVSYLVAAIATRGPYSLLALFAEQGSAKSTVARMIRGLIDPSSVPLVGTPREDRDLLIAANASHVIVIDNLSHVDGNLSDLLCCISTGIGYRARTLFTDSDETIISVCRPIVLTAISEVIQRGDLADRTITVPLLSIADKDRRDEAELWLEYEREKPLILGALYDAAATVLRCRAEVRRALKYRPRMLDYAVAATAAEGTYGVPGGTWQRAHQAMRSAAHAAMLETSLPRAVIALMAGRAAWEGTATELLSALEEMAELSSTPHKPQGWPRAANALSGALRRIAPDLRSEGIEMDLHAKGGPRFKQRMIRMWKTDVPTLSAAPSPVKLGKSSSAPSASSEAASNKDSLPTVPEDGSSASSQSSSAAMNESGAADDPTSSADDVPTILSWQIVGNEKPYITKGSSTLASLADDADDYLHSLNGDMAERGQ